MTEKFEGPFGEKISGICSGIGKLWRGYTSFASYETDLNIKGIYWKGRADFLEQADYHKAVIGAQFLLGNLEVLTGVGLLVAAFRSRKKRFQVPAILVGICLGNTGIQHIKDASKADDMLLNELHK